MFKNLAINNSSNYYGNEIYDNLLNIIVNYKEVFDSYLINIYNLNNEHEFDNNDTSNSMSIINFGKKNVITNNTFLNVEKFEEEEEEEQEQELFINFLEQNNNKNEKEQQQQQNDKIIDVCFLHNEHFLLTFMDLLIPFIVEKFKLTTKNYMVDDQNHMLITIVVQKILLINGKILQSKDENTQITLTTSYFDNNLLIHSGFEHNFSSLPINSNKKPIIFYLKD